MTTDDKFSKMECELRVIKEILCIIEKKLDALSVNIDQNIVGDCKKMGDHINFIENVYATVKLPMEYMCTKINYLTGREDVQNNKFILQ